ncbi:MAG TPA: alpha-amylase family glycosyl hydrolase [Thermotogota bacterium]|nr:alpha-amylase family glycosyl hydrolase [Thermotogota bacterium]
MKKIFLVTIFILLCPFLFAVKITFITSADASQVSIIGDFTGFKTESMEPVGGLWKYSTELVEGSYLYKYEIDGISSLDFKNTEIAVHEGQVYNIREIPAFSAAKTGDTKIGKIYFEETREYINPVEPGEIYLTIGFSEGDVEDVELQSNAIEITKEKFTLSKVDYFQFHVKTSASILKYRFLIKDGEEFLYGFNGGEAFSAFNFDQPLIAYMNIPDWARGATIYQIFPDRFRNSDTSLDLPYKPDWYSTPTSLNLGTAHYGGDLRGITDSVGYLKALNVDVVYLNPIFEADSTHKYNTTDYLRIDPAFGTEEDFVTTVDTLHANDIRVILDGVFNHTGTQFFAMRENFIKQEKSAFLDWYYISKFPIEETADSYRTWQGYASLPKLNTDKAEVRAYIAEVIGKWMKHGIDGWRLDTADQFPMRFLSDFLYPAVRSIKADAMVIGEYWEDAEEYFKTGCMNSVMNYLFRDAALTYASGGSSRAFENAVNDYLYKYPPQIADGLWNMLGSHDTPRFFTLLNEDVEDARLAILLQMTFKGSPVIYYGDELGLAGDGDPFCRQPYPWEDQSQWNMELTNLYKTLLAIRTESEALKRGTLRFIVDKAGVLGFEREYGNEKIIVLANSRSKAFKIKYELDAEYENLVDGERVDYVESVEGKAFMILRRKD